MAKRQITPGMLNILAQAAADVDGDAQRFTKNDVQGTALLSRGLTERNDAGRLVISAAGRALVEPDA